MDHPAIGLLEVTGVARGMVVCDAVVKRAGVEVLKSHPIDPGKYLILLAGPVAEIEEAMEAGEEAGDGVIMDRLLLPNAHAQLIPAIKGRTLPADIESLGIFEAHTLAQAIVGLDVALKVAEVCVVELRLGSGLAGKGYFVVTGELHDVEAAIEAALETAQSGALTEVIASPHPDFIKGAL